MKNILLVDDDRICNFIMGKTLEKMHLAENVDSVQDGKQAIDLLKNYSKSAHVMPDVILLDLNMPVLDGFGFLEAYNDLTFVDKQNTKIIIVSSSADPQDVIRAKAMGINTYITKPVSEEKLKGVLLN